MRFWIATEDIERIANTPETRGARLLDRLIAWLGEPDNRLSENVNDFQVFFSDEGETRIEPLG